MRRGPVLAALVAGEAAEAFEQQPAAASVERVLAVLRRIYEPQGIQVPAPVQVPPLHRDTGRCCACACALYADEVAILCYLCPTRYCVSLESHLRYAVVLRLRSGNMIQSLTHHVGWRRRPCARDGGRTQWRTAPIRA